MKLILALFILPTILLSSKTLATKCRRKSTPSIEEIPLPAFNHSLWTTSIDLYSNVQYYEVGSYVIAPFTLESSLSLLYLMSTKLTKHILRRKLDLHQLGREQIAINYQNIYQTLINIPTLKQANGLFIQNNAPVNSAFRTLAKDAFYTDAQSIDFSDKKNATNEINQWIEKNINKKVDQYFIPLRTYKLDDGIALISAAYFRADWQNSFDSALTTWERFSYGWCSANEFVTVPMMHQTGYYQVGYNAYWDADVIRLPLKFDLTMTIVLPTSCCRLGRTEDVLRDNSKRHLIKMFPYQKTNLHIPKFITNSMISMRRPLIHHGFHDLFSRSANITHIYADPTIKEHVTDVFQTVIVEINETGDGINSTVPISTKPSPSTTPLISKSQLLSGSSCEREQRYQSKKAARLQRTEKPCPHDHRSENEPIEFNANHPFLYTIEMDNNIILIGRFTGK